MRFVVSAVQCKVGGRDAFESAERLISSSGSDLYLLPEYFSYPVGDRSLETSEKTVEWLKNMSREFSAVIAGNIIRKGEDGYHNTLYLFDSGDLVGKQDKIHPTLSERELGIKCGRRLEVFEVRDVKTSALICADILYPELCRIPGLKEVDLVLNPVVSFKKSELPAQEYRYCLYFTRSFDNSYAIVKAGGFGKTFLGEDCVGRSLVSMPDGIVARYNDEESEELVRAEINLEKLREYRKVNYSLRDRNPEALKDLLGGGIEC